MLCRRLAEYSRRIADLERRFTGAGPAESQRLLETEDLGQRSLRGALTLKRLAGQIDVIVHAVGILTALPYVLAPGEVVESLSLGAGTGGKLHDLETNRQVAEFKFAAPAAHRPRICQISVCALHDRAQADTDLRRLGPRSDRHSCGRT
jgi:hypothetical protein